MDKTDKAEIVMELVLALVDKERVNFGNVTEIDTVAAGISNLYNSIYENIKLED